MTNTTRHAITELQRRPWCAATEDLCGIDPSFEAFVEAAKTRVTVPTIVTTRAHHFPRLIPKELHACPAFVIFLQDDFSECVFSLAHASAEVDSKLSGDLTQRDLVLSWSANNFAFTAFESSLHTSIAEQQDGGAIAVIFVSPTVTAITCTAIDADFLEELSWIGDRCGKGYLPTRDELRKAEARRSRDPYAFELDSKGRDVVLLRPRRFHRDRLL